MPRTWDEAEKLRSGIQEVEDLWDEEQEHGLAKVTEDRYHRKRHAREVAKCVPYKHI